MVDDLKRGRCDFHHGGRKHISMCILLVDATGRGNTSSNAATVTVLDKVRSTSLTVGVPFLLYMAIHGKSGAD